MDNNKNIELIIQLLKKHGLDQIVISPGGTNQKLVSMLQEDSFFKCYSVVDERSAIYFAIGLYLQCKKPIVTSCTSAQATRNYIPGLTEAYYKRVPILAITMMKHPRFTYQEYMQAPDQDSLPKDCVKKSYRLPCVSDDNDLIYSARVINEAILEMTHIWNGPIQLCVPWLDFPLKANTSLIKVINRYGIETFDFSRLEKKKIMIVIGEHLPFDVDLSREIECFCEKFDVVVYTNHLSNYSGKFSVGGNLQLLVMNLEVFNTKLKPDILISIGGQTGDYPFFNLFSRNDLKGIEHYRVATDGCVIDTYDKMTATIEAKEIEFFVACNQNKYCSDSHKFYSDWNDLFKTTNLDVDVPFSAVSIAQNLSRRLPKNSILQFSILNSLRIWNMFPIDHSIECFCNVGAFGIDGGMSTLIGQSVITEKKSFLIIGDLAFLYDMNSISIRHIKNNLRILLVNNGGGVEFKIWGGNLKSIDNYIAAAGHFKDARGWASTCGFKYLSAKNQTEFNEQIDVFVGDSVEPIILEAFVDDKDEGEAYSSLLNGNRNVPLSQKAKNFIKKLIK